MGPVTWLKAKYRTEKTKGRYKNGNKDQENTTVLVVGPTGKKRFQHG